jgi:excisionase family DNA binding protein
VSTLASRDVERAYLSISEVAMLVGVSGRTIRRRIATGELRAVKLGTAPNSVVRVSLEALVEWLANSEGPAAA